jgi:hypothetical protein
MVKGHIGTPVLQRENDADSHTILIRVKNAFPLKNQTLRMAKLLKIRQISEGNGRKILAKKAPLFPTKGQHFVSGGFTR